MSKKGRKEIKVTLVNPPINAVEQLAVVWQQSRSNNELLDAEVLHRLNSFNYSRFKDVIHVEELMSQSDILSWSSDYLHNEYNPEVISQFKSFIIDHGDLDINDDGKLLLLGQTLDDIFLMALDGDFPVIEHVPRLTFVIENMTVAFREQLVRSRSSSFWMQTSRINDYSNLYKEDRFRTPVGLVNDANSDSPKNAGMINDEGLRSRVADLFRRSDDELDGITGEDLFLALMEVDQMVYQSLLGMGFKMEDARELLPYNRLERGTVTKDLRAWKQLFRARSCWIAHAGHWRPVLSQMRVQMMNNVSPALSSITNPPCMSGDCKFKHCPYELDMRKRYVGDDPLEICPLFTLHYWDGGVSKKLLADMSKRLSEYDGFWSFWDSMMEDLSDKYGEFVGGDDA